MIGASTIAELLPTYESLSIKTLPTKVSYTKNEELSLDGMVLEAVFSDGTKKLVTEFLSEPLNGTVLTVDDTSVTISHTYRKVTHTASFDIVVADIKATYSVYNDSNYSYGFEQCNDGETDTHMPSGVSAFTSEWYKSKNYGVNSSTAGARIVVDGKADCTIKVHILDYTNESTYDYGTIVSWTGSTVFNGRKSSHVAGGEIVTIGKISANQTKQFYVSYTKDSSVNNANDRVYFKIIIE